jgi:hypothetical protein
MGLDVVRGFQERGRFFWETFPGEGIRRVAAAT